MATELLVTLRNGVHHQVRFEEDEAWELKDTERLVLFLTGDRVVRAAFNLQDFVSATALVQADGE